MAANDCRSRVQVVENGHGVLDEVFRRILDGRFSRAACAPIIVSDQLVIAAKLRHLENIPNIAGAGCFAKKHHRRALTMSFEIDVNLVAFDERHERISFPSVCSPITTVTWQMQSLSDVLVGHAKTPDPRFDICTGAVRVSIVGEVYNTWRELNLSLCGTGRRSGIIAAYGRAISTVI